MHPNWSLILFTVAALSCLIIALALVLPPLLRQRKAAAPDLRRAVNIAIYRDQMHELAADRDAGLLSETQFQLGKHELEARLAEDALLQPELVPAPVASRRLGFSLAGLLPAAAIGLYLWLGNPLALISDVQADASIARQDGHSISKLVREVVEKTRTHPEDGEAWAILAKTHATTGNWPEALRAYEKAIRLKPDLPSVMTGYAEALAVSRNRVLQGEPMQLVLNALEKDPDDLKGLELAGLGAFQEKNYAQAGYYFKRLLKLLPPESPYAGDIREAQKEANRLAQGALTGLDDLAAPAGDGPGSIRGKVDIAPALKARVGEQDVIFLFARAAQSGVSVAALRAPVGRFPLEFELTDAMAANPEQRLSQVGEVNLTARIAKSGQPMGATGDLEGSIKRIKAGAQDVTLLIDSVRP
jgi:cytochrome c-type biogenesis protein CcmH